MDASRGLITKLCDEGKLNEVQRSGITTDFFDEESALVFRFIQRHFTDYKRVPSRDAVLKAFPNYDFANYTEPLEYFINEIKETFRRAVLEEKIGEIGSVYTGSTEKAEKILRETLSELQVTSKNFKDLNLAENALERFDLYEHRKDNPPEDGILSGWPKMDYQTLGWHPEEFIVLVGEKYVGKSWTMIWLAYKALLQGENVLFITKEMSSQAITRRFDSIYANVRFDALRRGELTETEEKRYREKMEELSNSNLNFTVAREGISTIEDIEAKAVETDATIIFGDSIYLFLPDSRTTFSGEVNKRLAVSQKCKDISRKLGIPFIVSVQAGRKKSKNQEPDLDDIEWSNAFSQDADTVFYVEKKDIDKELNRIHVHLLKSRDGDITKLYVDTNFEYMTFEERDDEEEPTTDIQFEDDEDDEVIEF